MMVKLMHAYQSQADRMVDRQLRHRGLRDEAVLEAMRVVPRHLFVPESHRAEAYADSFLTLAHCFPVRSILFGDGRVNRR